MSKYGISYFPFLANENAFLQLLSQPGAQMFFTKECSIWYDLKAYLLLSGERKKWSSYTIPALWLLPRTISGPARQGRFLNKICPPGPECDAGYVDPPNFGKKTRVIELVVLELAPLLIDQQTCLAGFTKTIKSVDNCKYSTLPIAEILSGKNAWAFLVCGFLMKSFKKIS